MRSMRKQSKIVTLLSGGAPTPFYLAGGVSASNCIAVYQGVGAASLAASYVNLINPGVGDLTKRETNDPAWTTGGGWQFDGLNGVLRMNFNTVAQQARTAIVGYTQSSFAALGCVFGSQTAGLFLQYNQSTDKTVFYNGAGYSNNRVTSGIAAIAGTNAYLNGVDVGDMAAGSYGAAEMYLGALNSSGSIIQRFIGFIEWFAYYNVTLTPAQIAAIGAASP